jgi:hypothetical protein
MQPLTNPLVTRYPRDLVRPDDRTLSIFALDMPFCL